MTVTILSAVLVLGLLIFVHELGHFLVAKMSGVGVEKFSLGFGPRLLGFRRGETEYLVSAFPLGGYVKMVGEVDESELSEEDRRRSFMGKPPLVRIAIVAAGPVSNLLFAWLLVIVVFMIGVPKVTPKVGEVVEGKPAQRAGIKSGDLIVSIEGKPVDRWDDIASTISRAGRGEVAISLKRDDQLLTVRVTPEQIPGKNLFGEPVSRPVIGIVSARETVTERLPLHRAVVEGSRKTWEIVEVTVLSIVKLIERVVPLDTVGGPIMIAKMAGEQAREGGVSLLLFMALLSINLGILNLLPVPILDGGHLFFYTWEALFRKPISMRTREIAQQVGLFLLVSLMILAFYNDIARFVLR